VSHKHRHAVPVLSTRPPASPHLSHALTPAYTLQVEVHTCRGEGVRLPGAADCSSFRVHDILWAWKPSVVEW